MSPIASASLQPYGSFRYKHTRSLSLICLIEVDNILAFGSNVSLRNGQLYPLLPPPLPPFYRRRLCICGAIIIYPTILPVWSFCPRGVKTSSLFVAYFFHKNSNRFCGIYKMFIFDLQALLEITRTNLVPRWHEVRERKQKRPVLTHTDHGKHQKANGARSLKMSRAYV